MIQLQTILKIADNSGASAAKCIKILGGFKKKTAKIGDIVVVTIKELRNNLKKINKIKKKEIRKGIVVRTKKKIKQKSGEVLQFNENAVILLNKQKNLAGTRIFGFLPNKFKEKKFQKILGAVLRTL